MNRVMICASFARSLINLRGPLIREIVSNNWDVHVTAPSIDGNVRNELHKMGCSVYETSLTRHGTRILSDLRYFLTLVQLIRKIRPTLILTYTIKPNIWGALAGYLFGIQSIALVTGLGYAFTRNAGLRSYLARLVATLLYRLATSCNRVVVFQNPDDREEFIAAGCLADQSKARLINGSGVDCAHYMPAPLPDKPVFLMISRLLKNKGVREFGEAVIRLKQSRPQSRCFLIGFFDEGPDCIDRSQLETWVMGGMEFLGKMDDVRPALASCSVYVLPSYREGTPRSVLEAMATGRAILTSDAPGCRETVVDGVNGFLIPVGDTDSLYNRMVQLVDDPGLRSRMAYESLRIAREKYDVRSVNRTLLRYLNEVDHAFKFRT